MAKRGAALKRVFLKQPVLRQGLHIDPTDPAVGPPRPQAWSRSARDAFRSPEMERFREGLCLPALAGIREAVLDDLVEFYGLDVEECVRRCLHWEELSVDEWQAADRSTDQGRVDFYRTTTSWAFDLLWYAYLQSEGYAPPLSVQIARFLAGRAHGACHLDFGSGVGATSQLFGRLGYETHLGDISRSLLEFARFRLERRGDRAEYLDLTEVELEAGRYDVITAIDTLAHVPDVGETAAALHRALRPGGWLLANLDVRPATDENAWHLYEHAAPLRQSVQRAGFAQRAVIDAEMRCYQKVSDRGIAHAVRGAFDAVWLGNPLRPRLARVRWPTPGALRRRWARRPACPPGPRGASSDAAG